MMGESSDNPNIDVDLANKIIRLQLDRTKAKRKAQSLYIIIIALLILLIFLFIRPFGYYDFNTWLTWWVISLMISIFIRFVIKYSNGERLNKVPSLGIYSTFRWIFVLLILSFMIILFFYDPDHLDPFFILFLVPINLTLSLIIEVELLDFITEIKQVDGHLEGIFFETSYLLPFKIKRIMKFKPDTDGNFRIMIFYRQRVPRNREGYLFRNIFYSEQEFMEEFQEKNYFIGFYDPETNTELKSIGGITTSNVKEDIIKLLKEFRAFGDIKVVKLQQSEVGINILKNKFIVRNLDDGKMLII